MSVHCVLPLDKEEIAHERRMYCMIKRAQDVALSLLALAILIVPMMILAVIICIDSPGASPLFCQRRVGLNGKEFTMMKFRTMIPHAEQKLEVLLSQNEMNGVLPGSGVLFGESVRMNCLSCGTYWLDR